MNGRVPPTADFGARPAFLQCMLAFSLIGPLPLLPALGADASVAPADEGAFATLEG